MIQPKVIRISIACMICISTYAELHPYRGQSSRKVASGSPEQNQPTTKEKKVYTNEDLILLREKSRINQAESSPAETTGRSGKVPVGRKGRRKQSESSTGLSGYRDINGHDRAYWQGKIRPLRSKLENLNSQIQSLQTRQSETTAASGIRVSRRGRLRAGSADTRHSLSRRMGELERKKTGVLRSIQDLEEEARKAQALPEWLR